MVICGCCCSELISSSSPALLAIEAGADDSLLRADSSCCSRSCSARPKGSGRSSNGASFSGASVVRPKGSSRSASRGNPFSETFFVSTGDGGLGDGNRPPLSEASSVSEEDADASPSTAPGKSFFRSNLFGTGDFGTGPRPGDSFDPMEAFASKAPASTTDADDEPVAAASATAGGPAGTGAAEGSGGGADEDDEDLDGEANPKSPSNPSSELCLASPLSLCTAETATRSGEAARGRERWSDGDDLDFEMPTIVAEAVGVTMAVRECDRDRDRDCKVGAGAATAATGEVATRAAQGTEDSSRTMDVHKPVGRKVGTGNGGIPSSSSGGVFGAQSGISSSSS
mmetsp:Transcript_151807/g.487121  ORF Transcript_151807/g.487121 Transcript_151807/m.487121 type:complete len:341 (+) Transcript_151807:1884-2906(+)